MLQKKHKASDKKEFCWQMALFTGVLVLVGVCSLFLKKPVYSEAEKRQLTSRPPFSAQSLWSGEYTRQLELYYADTFPLRDMMVSLSSGVKESLGIRFGDVRILGEVGAPVDTPDPTLQNSASQSSSSSSSSSSSVSSKEESSSSSVAESTQSGNDDISQTQNGILIYQGRGMSLFGGSESVGKLYAQNINRYAETLGDKVRVFDLVVPTSAEFYLPEKYKKLSNSQKNAIDSIYSHLDSAVTGVDAYSEIAAHTDEYLYFNTDHHWTGRGAYYAYRAFAKAAGFVPLELDEFETRVIDGFLGTLYSQTNDSKMREKGDYVEYFIPPTDATASIIYRDNPYTSYRHMVWNERVKGANSYLVFLSGDPPMVQIDTACKNGKSIAVVKESFGNAFAPFLISHYEHIYVVDERYYQTSLIALINEKKIDDILFVNNAFSAMTAYHANNLQKLMYQVYVPPIESEPDTSSSEEESTEDHPGRLDTDDDEDEDD